MESLFLSGLNFPSIKQQTSKKMQSQDCVILFCNEITEEVLFCNEITEEVLFCNEIPEGVIFYNNITQKLLSNQICQKYSLRWNLPTNIVLQWKCHPITTPERTLDERHVCSPHPSSQREAKAWTSKHLYRCFEVQAVAQSFLKLLETFQTQIAFPPVSFFTFLLTEFHQKQHFVQCTQKINSQKDNVELNKPHGPWVMAIWMIKYHEWKIEHEQRSLTNKSSWRSTLLEVGQFESWRPKVKQMFYCCCSSPCGRWQSGSLIPVGHKPLLIAFPCPYLWLPLSKNSTLIVNT